MIASAAFIVGFVIIGLTVLLTAMRGGPRGAREAMHTQTARGRQTAAGIITGLAVIFGIGIPAAVLAANSDNDRSAKGGVELSHAQAEGRVMFTANCGMCHTLGAAATSGRVGPNLDTLRPPKALTLDAIKNGRARGQGQMPSELIEGEDAENVASFIEAVAGR